MQIGHLVELVAALVLVGEEDRRVTVFGIVAVSTCCKFLWVLPFDHLKYKQQRNKQSPVLSK